MTQFLSYHETDRAIPLVAYAADNTARVQIPKGHRYSHFNGRLTATLTHGGGAAAVGAVQAGILALIQSMYVQINGGEPKWSTSGDEIFVNSIELIRETPRGMGVIALGATATYIVDFQYRFDERVLANYGQYGLDLLTIPGRGDPFTSHELVVKWGSANNVFASAGDMSVTAASIEFWANEKKLSAINPFTGQPMQYDRSREIVRRKITKAFTAAGDLLIELPRVEGSRLISVVARQTYKNAQSDFTNTGGKVKLAHEEYDFKEAPLWVRQAEQEVGPGEAVPGNIVIVPVVDYGVLATAKANGEFKDNLELTLPVNMDAGAGGSTADHKVDVFLRYEKTFKIA